jgi:hypothetical protein
MHLILGTNKYFIRAVVANYLKPTQIKRLSKCTILSYALYNRKLTL